METITRNVDDLTPSERNVYETVLGHSLRSGQKVIVQFIDAPADDEETVQNVSVDKAMAKDDRNPVALPGWCSVYEGLSEQEVDDVEKSILARCTSTRNVNLDF